MINDLKVRFEDLSGDKQIEILNYIKNNIKLENNQMYVDINSLENIISIKNNNCSKNRTVDKEIN